MDGIGEVKRLMEVSRETEERLETYARLLRQWQLRQNLVSNGSLGSLWRRHIADSAQTHLALPDARKWVDFGSGAGFPGLVTAILLAGTPGSVVHLIESNQRKAAFLKTVIRETGISAMVHPDRIENVLQGWRLPVDGVSARALASLDLLCGLAKGLVGAGAKAVFHKGNKYRWEIENASHNWTMNLVRKDSQTDKSACLLVIDRIVARKIEGSAAYEPPR